MERKNNLQQKSIRPLDTLAQKRTSINEKAPKVVVGQGTKIEDRLPLTGRAKRKTVTQVMNLNLVKIGTRKHKTEMVQSYWNAYHCQSHLVSDDSKIYGKYCKNRFCTLCCSIRKAVIINRYLPTLKNWKDCHFVTLTRKAVRANDLRKCLKDMLKVFARIIDKHRKRYNRGKGFVLVGIKSLECNFNPDRRTYNPHFHVLVLNREMGQILIDEWLNYYRGGISIRRAQFIRKVDDQERDLIEIVKYGSKIFTELFLNSSRPAKSKPIIYISALDTILTAMAKLRIFERFGFNLPPQGNTVVGSVPKVLSDYGEWSFVLRQADWLNSETGELLTQFTAHRELTSLLKNNIDLKLE